jgi:hypothetical protein
VVAYCTVGTIMQLICKRKGDHHCIATLTMPSSLALGQHLLVHVPTSRNSLQANRKVANSSARTARLAARAHRQQLLGRDGENAADTTSDKVQRRRGSGLGDLLGPIGLTLGGQSRSVCAAQISCLSCRTQCLMY